MRRSCGVVVGIVIVFALCAISLKPGLLTVRAEGDNPIEVLSQSTSSVFRTSFTFKITVQSSAGKITKARVVWYPFSTSDPVSENVVIPQYDGQLELQHQWNTKQVTTPPWQPILYHWEFTDDAGNEFSSPEVRAELEDTSHTWKKLSDDKVSVYYYDHPNSFGQDLLKVAQEGYARVVETTGYTPTGDLRVVMYNSEDDFCSFWAPGQCATWIAGVTIGSTTVAWLDPKQESFVMRQVVPHELSHAFLNDWLGPRIRAIPRWFNEGQAVNVELQGVNDELQTARDLAISFKLQRLGQMDSFPNSGRTQSARVDNWYAESTSLVFYLYQEYGVDSLGKILEKVKSGESFPQAMQDVTGMTLTDYEVAWRHWIGADSKAP